MRKTYFDPVRRVRGCMVVFAVGLVALLAAESRGDYVTAVSSDNPLAWYRFEDATTDNGDTAADTTANGINGQYISYIQQANGPGGIGGKAAAFDGIDSYIDTLVANESQFDFIGSSFSFEAWVQVGTFDKTWQALAAKGDDSWRVARRDVGNSPSFAANGLAGEPVLGTAIDDGNWHHVVAVVDLAAGQKLEYVDGVLNAPAQPVVGPINNSAFALFIGENSQARGRYWNGAIDEVAIYNHALTAADVTDHFTQGGGAGQAGSVLPMPNIGNPTPVESPAGGQGTFGVRVVHDTAVVSGVAGALATLAKPELRGDRYTKDVTAPMINFADPQAAGGGYSTGAEYGDKAPFAFDSPADDNNLAMIAKGKVRIPADGNYTFGIDGDDGVRLKLSGANFTLQGGLGTAAGDTIEFAADTGDAFTIASTFMAAGDYDVEVVYNENGGGAFVEAFSAAGVKTAIDRTFSPIGYGGFTHPGGAVPTVTGGFSVTERIRLPENTQLLNSLADARALLDNPLEGDDLEFTGNRTVINFQDDGTFGSSSRFGGDELFLNNFVGGGGEVIDDNDFAMRATGTLHVATAGTYTFGFGSDDGNALTITGGVFTAITAGGGGVAAIIDGGATLAFDVNTGDSFTLATMTLAAGDYPMEYLMWERGGGASSELFVAPGEHSRFNPALFTLLNGTDTIPPLNLLPGLELIGDASGVLGDTDGDDDVDITDLNNVRNNFSGTGLGDTDDDNDVDITDLNNVRNNFGAGQGGANAVPEPSSMVLAGLGLVGLLAARRFRK